MAESQRIEDLRKRYHENPRRFFAPLANEYRKAGFLDRSLLLCEKHLREQPDNLNGLVVFGQTLFESGKHAEAREPFEAALALDQENLIALRHLGDIARLGGDHDTAKRWYEKVLELDRRNDEVLDLLQQMGGGEASTESSTNQTGSIPLVTVGSGVSVSSSDDVTDLGMVNLDPTPAPPPPPRPKPSAGPGKTVVIDAAALAAADLKRAQAAAAPTAEVGAMKAPIVESPSAKAPISEGPSARVSAPIVEGASAKRPSKRASLLDINFDFSEMPAEDAAPVAPAAPVMGAEAAEYGFAGGGVPEPTPETMPTGAGEHTLIIDASPAGESMSGGPVGGMAGLELNSDADPGVAPMAGLEATEFTGGDAAPMSGLETQEVVAADVAPLAGLDRVDMEEIKEAASASPTLEIAAVRPVTPVEPPATLAINDPIDLDVPEDSAPLTFLEDPPSARPKPRMTRADLASLPLLADFGLEDDEPKTSPMEPASAPAPEPIVEAPSAKAPIVESPSAGEPRKPQKTPAFVTETMAALYLQQGYKKEAMDVYRQLIAQDPSDAGLKERLAALERGDETGLEFEAPPADATEPAPAPANAVLADMSFAGVGLTTPAPSAPKLEMPAASGPSARDFFSNFARRAAQPSNGSVAAPAPATSDAPAAAPAPAAAVTKSGWPLDALFGAANDVTDLHAAEVLAGVATFAGPSGGTGLDTLFSAEPAAARPVVARASQTLKFDQFFAGGTPAADAPAAPDAPSSPAAAGDDDLNKFQGWLKGLKPQ